MEGGSWAGGMSDVYGVNTKRVSRSSLPLLLLLLLVHVVLRDRRLLRCMQMARDLVLLYLHRSH